MKTKRMTIEELEALKPSIENKIELVCDDGYFTRVMQTIKVIAVYNGKFAYINAEDVIESTCTSLLKHYPSFEKKDDIRTLYECFLSDSVALSWYFDDGRWYNFADKRMSMGCYNQKLVKTGRTLKVNIDTGEIVK